MYLTGAAVIVLSLHSATLIFHYIDDILSTFFWELSCALYPLIEGIAEWTKKHSKCLNPFYTLEIVLGETWHHLSTIYAFDDCMKIKS